MLDFITKGNKEGYYKFIGVVLILLLWQIISFFSHPLIVPSIGKTGAALYKLFASGEALASLFVTIQRQLLGLALGVFFGVGVGLLGGVHRPFHSILMPAINSILAIPSVIFVVLALVWFGVGSKQVIFVVALLTFPIMYINTAKSLHSIDTRLLQMAQVFHVPWKIKVRKIYLPGILHGFIAGFTLSVSSSLRITVFAEVFGAENGIGPAISSARNYLETDKLFAWTIILIVLVVAVEYLILKPIENSMKKGNVTSSV